MTEMTKAAKLLSDALLDAKLKLQLYREKHSGEYIGGVEYTELMRRIDAALAFHASQKVIASESMTVHGGWPDIQR